MFTAAALIPSPPILVPELNGASAAGSAELRSAALTAGARLGAAASNWMVVGGRDTDRTVDSTRCGTFRGFGVDVAVALSPDAAGEPDPEWPLPALIAGWLRGQTSPQVRAQVRLPAADTSPQECALLGAALRTEMDRDSRSWGLLVIADGSARLTDKAPGAFDSRAGKFQDDLDTALGSGDCGALAQLDPAFCTEVAAAGRPAYQVLAGVFGDDAIAAESLYCAAPFGVGYHVAYWEPRVANPGTGS